MTARQLEAIAGFGHGLTLFGHFIGIFFNLYRGRRVHAAIHAGAFAYNAISVFSHVADAKGK